MRSLRNATTTEHPSCTPCFQLSRTPVNSLFDTRHHHAPLQSSESPPHPNLTEMQMRYEGPRITSPKGNSPTKSTIPRVLGARSVSTSILPAGEGRNSKIQPTRPLIPARHRSEGLIAPSVPVISVNLKRKSKQSTGSHSAIELLPMWLQQCKSLHGDACRPPSLALNHEAPRFLVDLQYNGQIIFTAQKTRYDYVALSYHRLLENHVDLSRDQMLELRHSKALFEHPLLPPIVHETMELVRGVGERYIWIDFLCLAHGDDNVLDEMERMDKIYAGALFTVIAACTDGLQERTQPPQDQPLNTGDKTIDAMVYHYKTLGGSKWATRGWTFQERMFSRRSIVFVPKSYIDPTLRRQAQLQDGAPDRCFFWECERAMWDDWHLTAPSTPSIGDAANLGDPRLLKPHATTEHRLQFARYLQTVYYYNSREFRNPQDVLRAISGCLRLLSEDFPRSFSSGFIYGLPVRKFHESLLWQPRGTSSQRTCRCENHHESPHQVLPSWSWCGWQCELDLQSMPVDQRENLSDTERMEAFAWEIKPLVHWELLWTDGKRRPLVSMSSRRPTAGKRESPRLTCEAYMARLVIRRLHSSPSSSLRPLRRRALGVKVPVAKLQSPQTRQVASLEHHDGTWAGVLGLREACERTEACGQEVLLMAISEGSVSYEKLENSYEEKTDKHNTEKLLDVERNNPLHNGHSPCSVYSFVNVLWVEKKNDHFSRKALGRVEATVWRKLCLGKRPTQVVLE
jgi:hypothetical protein